MASMRSSPMAVQGEIQTPLCGRNRRTTSRLLSICDALDQLRPNGTARSVCAFVPIAPSRSSYAIDATSGA